MPNESAIMSPYWEEDAIISLGSKKKNKIWGSLITSFIVILIVTVMASIILYFTIVPRKEGFDPIKRIKYTRRPICERICSAYTDPCQNYQWQYAGGATTCEDKVCRYPTLKDKCMLSCRMNRYHK
jgi:hypothetical protein